MAEKKKVNCWEFKKCGRELGGKNTKDLGVCPVTSAQVADGIHDGMNGGRCCWVVSGSLCKGEVQGTFAKKFRDCHQCDFYNVVRREEQPKFEVTLSLLREIKGKKWKAPMQRGRKLCIYFTNTAVDTNDTFHGNSFIRQQVPK